MDIFATSGKDKWHREAESNSFLMEPANPIYDADEARSNGVEGLTHHKTC